MGNVGITPQFFERVELAPVAQKHVYHHVHVVEQHPLAVGAALGLPGRLAGEFFYFLFYRAGNGLNLGVGRSRADDKVICNGIFKVFKVEYDDVGPFFLLHAANDNFCQLVRILSNGGTFHKVLVGLTSTKYEKQMAVISPQTLFTGQQLLWLPECGSTNSEAQLLAGQNRATDGCCVITDKQTAGRGQRGNQWEAAPGENLTLSVVWKPTFLPAADQFLLSQAVALALHDWLLTLLGPAPALRVKWPNDLYYGAQKLGGILIENTLSGPKIQHSIVGVGLNVNQRQFGVGTATSLSQLTGRTYALAELAGRLLESLERRYLQLRAGQLQALRTDYLAVLYRFGELHAYEADGQRLHGRIVGLDAAGRLALETAGQLRHFDLKQIRYL